MVFSIPPIVVMVVDSATGGSWGGVENGGTSGKWNPGVLFPLYMLCGVCYGVIEIGKRVVPRMLVGGEMAKLRQIDSVVTIRTTSYSQSFFLIWTLQMHIFYEAAGTAGAFLSSTLLLKWGCVYSMILTPFCFLISAAAWYFISPPPRPPRSPFRSSTATSDGIQHIDPVFSAPTLSITSLSPTRKATFTLSHLLRTLGRVFADFGHSVLLGGRIIFTIRAFCWLPLGYSLSLYAHRYLENGLLPIIAQGYFGHAEYTQILVGGSNLGELLGAFIVLVVGGWCETPIPWVRLDALLLGLVWILPFYGRGFNGIKTIPVSEVWKLVPVIIPISMAWAAGDVGLVSFIQASLGAPDQDEDHPALHYDSDELDNFHPDTKSQSRSRVNPLGAVMACLYSIYIILFSVLSPILGRFADDTSGAGAHRTVLALGGIQYSIIAAVLVASTFVMRGSGAWNPKMKKGVKAGWYPGESGKELEAGGVRRRRRRGVLNGEDLGWVPAEKEGGVGGERMEEVNGQVDDEVRGMER